ncbi:Protein farnesyltransferase/geranylgeranyltransferase type-1 subunit alpha [Histomonas meleagridis]|uniref:Protein farnesyltransferase/geranylgeranyltransferase type-1 subunit alpha n=1 Tax=Histomonas meleagridis TaxID=135588 RepID=UPI003559A485|nr:Protein farnesyltransferase/geranylgeranyltransferase type-1 subunit alpha [Histomonas meleagridis]KAH0803881.1 Protein farnesyltransferase/geranylgeranyltransferase type-1 subunit alpha [Histomonas meleagridis]
MSAPETHEEANPQLKEQAQTHADTEDDEASYEGEENVLWANSQEWADLEPVPGVQKKGDPFYIDWEPFYDQMMSYFRGVMNVNEYSQRANELVKTVLMNVPGNPCAWWYRRKILEKLGYDSDEEILFTHEILEECLKSYQIWYHRQWVVDNQEEKPVDASLLSDRIQNDPKNFHAWSYALWLARRWNMYQDILDLTTYYLEQDPENNSAWSARFSVIDGAKADLSGELDFAFKTLENDLQNESACSYILGIAKKSDELYKKALENAKKLYQATPDNFHLISPIFCVSIGDNVGDLDGVGDFDGEGFCDLDGVGDFDSEDDFDGEGVDDLEGVGDFDGEGVGDFDGEGVGDLEGVGDFDGEGVGDLEGVGDFDGEGVGDLEGVGDFDGDGVGDLDGEGDFVGSGVGDGVAIIQ